MSRQRSRGWCFTINNYTFEDIVELLDVPSDYLIVGFEVGENGTPHIQGYLWNYNPVSFSSVQRHLPRANIRKAVGSPQQNYTYCSKDGEYYEFGERPEQGKATFEQIEQVMKDPKINFQLYNQYKKNYDTYRLFKENNNEKHLIFVHEDRQNEVYEKHRDEIFYDTDVDTYDGEDIVMMGAYNHGSFQVEKWFMGFPKRVKRGFQIVKVNPTYMYIVYSNKTELGHIKKCFIKLEYEVWSNEEVSQEQVDALLGSQDILEPVDIKESLENYDLTRR